MLTVGVPSLQPAMCNFSSHPAAKTSLRGKGQHPLKPGSSGRKVCSWLASVAWCLADYVRSPTLQGETTFAKLWKASPVPYVAGSFTADDDDALELPFPRLTARAAHPDRVHCSNPRPSERTNQRQLHTVPHSRCLAASDCRTADPAKAWKLRARNASPRCPLPFLPGARKH